MKFLPLTKPTRKNKLHCSDEFYQPGNLRSKKENRGRLASPSPPALPNAPDQVTRREKLTSKDQTLLIRGDALLVLNLGLDILDRVRRLDLQGDRLPGQCLDKDLHASAQAQDQVQGRLLLDVVVRQSATVLQLLA